MRSHRAAFVSFALALAVVLAGCADPIVGGQCQSGLTACSGLCVDLMSDPHHCGGCGITCGNGVACIAGVCGGSRDASVGEGGSDGGVGMDGSLLDGGRDGAVTMPDGSTHDGSIVDGSIIDGSIVDGSIIDGSIVGDGGIIGDPTIVPCDLGERSCSGVCVRPETDPSNCGGCGIMCTSGQFCSAGTCMAACVAPTLRCGGRCIDVTSDADNCGACGTRCPSGICIASACADPSAGHIVLVGHDYVSSRPGMNRIAGNAVLLARGSPVRVLVFEGTASRAAIRGTDRAINQVTTATGRTWSRTLAATEGDVPLLLADADAFVIYAQSGPNDATLVKDGSDWAPALTSFLRRGGVIVVFDGYTTADAGTWEILQAAGLFTASGRYDVSGDDVDVVAPGDGVALGVPLTYLGESTTVRFDTTEATVVVSDAAGPVVIHRVVTP